MKHRILSSILVLGLIAIFAVPAFGQVSIKDLGYLAPGGNVEPGANVDMLPGTPPDPVELGDGIIIMKFEICDQDPLADDRSDVALTQLDVDNLGTATEFDIEQIMVIDENNFIVGSVVSPTTPLDENFNIAFSAEIVLELDRIIPDNQCEVFSVAVLTHPTAELDFDTPSPGSPYGDPDLHTLRLRVRVHFHEDIGSADPASTDFTESVTDGAPEYICNCGINAVTDDMYVVNPLMPGMEGVVSRFTVCDNDSNEYNLYLNQLFMKQGDLGSAEHTDIATIKVYRVESSGRTQLAAFTPTVAFNRRGLGDPILGGPSPAAGGPYDYDHVIIVTDDSCAVFEVEAEVSTFAFKGRLIQLEFNISAQEPRDTQIGEDGPVSGIDPEIETSVPTVIGKGMIMLPSTIVLGSPGDIPLNVQGIPIPGLGSLQVGPTGALHFDPAVIRILEIVGVGDYVVEAVDIDNRRGEARFTVRIDPAEAPNGLSNGTVAIVRVDGVGDPGDRTRLFLNFDQVTDAFNNVLADANNALTLSNVGVIEGQVRLVPPGDVDGDGFTTISDALLLAEQLILGTPCAALSDEQKVIADVAAPFADIDVTPTCTGTNPTLTSADVAQIAKLSITTAAAGVASSAVKMASVKPLQVSQVQTAMRLGLLEFRAQGTGIAGMEVQLFSLSGRALATEQTTGNRLMVRAQDASGKALANGVYLYVVTVHGQDGSAVRSEVKKLVILR